MKSSRHPEGLGQMQAERVFARLRSKIDKTISQANGRTVAAAAVATRETISLSGCSLSHLRGCESMYRHHIGPVIGDMEISEVRRADVERVVAQMRDRGLSAGSIRSCIGHLTAVFDTAVDRGWTLDNPARRASRPRRRPPEGDIRFLTMKEVDRVVEAIPNAVGLPRLARNGGWNVGPCLDRWADHYPPVLRVVVATAAMTGMRQSELLGLRVA